MLQRAGETIDPDAIISVEGILPGSRLPRNWNLIRRCGKLEYRTYGDADAGGNPNLCVCG